LRRTAREKERKSNIMGVRGLASYVAKHKDYKYQEHIDLIEWSKQKGFGMKIVIINDNLYYLRTDIIKSPLYVIIEYTSCKLPPVD
jgi:hypothetical protein